MSESSQQIPDIPPFNPEAPHMQKPRLRPVQGFPVQHQGQQFLGLRDPSMLSERVVFTSPAATQLLPLMDGSRTIEEIVSEVGHGLTVEMMQGIVAQLDGAMLLEGPSFDAHLQKLKDEFNASEILPPAGTATLVEMLELNARRQAYIARKQEEGEIFNPQDVMQVPPEELQSIEVDPPDELLRRQLDNWMTKALEQVDDPSFDDLPRAVVVPHLDYPRGWPNYAAAYGRMRVVDRPDRVIILGTNHHGQGTGVVGCSKGFETPLGVCAADKDALDFLQKKLDETEAGLGEKLLEHEFDHEREHSIELQVAWIQHIFGKDDSGEYPRIISLLCHDISRTQDGESYDGKGVGLVPVVDALRQLIETLPGKTLVVASADLSHIGPQFGDQKQVDENWRNEIAKTDREMLELLVEKKPEQLVSSMAWQQNPTRWCSIGNLVAAAQIVQPEEVRILSYGAAADPQGMGCVTSCAMVMV